MTLNEILEDVSSEEGPTRFADGMPVTVAGIVASSKTRPTKNGSLMAYVVLEDETASMELLCFSRVLEQVRQLSGSEQPGTHQGTAEPAGRKSRRRSCRTWYSR